MSHPLRTEILAGMAPVLLLVGTAVLIGIHAALRRHSDARFYRWMAVLGGLGAAATLFFEAYRTRFNASGIFVNTPSTHNLASGSLVVDRLSLFAGILLCAVVVIVALVSQPFVTRHPMRSGAFHGVVLVMAAAGYVLVSEHEMATLLVAAVALGVGVVVLCSLAKTERRSAEAALGNTVILGVAVGVLAYGLALIYGVTGGSDLYALGGVFSHARLLGSIGVTLTLLGLFGLAGILPLQRWFVDVAEAVPAGVAGAIWALTVPPVIICSLRIAALAWNGDVWWWKGTVGVLLVLTAAYSALMASRQTSVRRLIAYTTSGQVAVVLVGIVAVGPGIDGHGAGGATALLFDLCVLTATVLSLYSVIAVAEAAGITDSIHSYTGLTRHLRSLGAFMVIPVASLCALPPLGLFMGHLLVWESAMSAGYGWLVALLVLAVGLLALAPLRLLGTLFAHTEDDAPSVEATETLPRPGRLALALCCVAPLLATVLFEPLMILASSAAKVL